MPASVVASEASVTTAYGKGTAGTSRPGTLYHEGWLRKESREHAVLGLLPVRRFQKRFFELSGTTLRYWKRAPGTTAGDEARTIDLAKTVVEEVPATAGSDGMPGIALRGLRLPRDYVFRAATSRDHQRWLAVLTSASRSAAITLEDFALEQVLGTGAFGQVYRARCIHTNKVYALKIIDKQKVENEVELKQVQEEKRLLQQAQAKGSHPFIVRLHCAFQTPGSLCLLMDCLQGGELFHHITRRKFTEEEAKLATCQLILALHHLHSQGVVYRDLKPENVVLDEHGNLVLTDLGLAARVGHDGKLPGGMRVGSPSYWAPELLRREEHSGAVDYWALGCVVYELLTQRHPWATVNSNGHVPFAAPMTEPLDLSPLKGVTPECRSFIQALLTAEPAQRLQCLAQAQSHRWLRGVNWDDVRQRKVQPRFAPGADPTRNVDPEVRRKPPVCPAPTTAFHVADFDWCPDLTLTWPAVPATGDASSRSKTPRPLSRQTAFGSGRSYVSSSSANSGNSAGSASMS
eukprot:TRINITY_DN1627_c0_g1_i1.p1 TRINITY_DN1627_c0_g1~~TRINITY_DN1627_c0_g1_i1.p1  ORF type:complete len:536 (+),score=75.99 TRINITY_DN1627_c0_g1_i1:55-1608(+)